MYSAEQVWTALLANPPEALATGHLTMQNGGEPVRLPRDEGPVPDAALSEDARKLLAIYLPLCRSHTFTVGQMGQSLDGRIATRTGHSHYVTGTEDRHHLHRLRALADAVLVGHRTVAADNPRLTVRHVTGEHPVRVVLDAGRQLNARHHVFQDRSAPTLLLHDSECTTGQLPRHVECLGLPTERGRFSPQTVVLALRQRGLNRLLVEGGGRLVSAFLQAGTLDRLFVTVAPVIVGSGVPSFTLPAIDRLDQALRPSCRQFSLGEDRLFVFSLDQSTHAPGRLPRSTVSP